MGTKRTKNAKHTKTAPVRAVIPILAHAQNTSDPQSSVLVRFVLVPFVFFFALVAFVLKPPRSGSTAECTRRTQGQWAPKQP
jgi:hypothetical protein